jgi:Tol biopolymer transport system component
VFGVYSLRDKTWATYGDFCGGSIGSQVFSSDGSKIAFAALSRLSSDHSDCLHNPFVLQILDIATGKLTPLPYNGAIYESARLSWSPDGKYLAGQIGAWVDPIKQIVVIDVGSGSARVIAEGINPSWSPKGDWIAYQDDKGLKCMVIRPDGTGAKEILDLEKRFHGYRTFLQGAVWSPDGEKLLLNEAKGVSDGIDVTMLDLASGKVTTTFKNRLAVLSWVTDRR